MEAVLITASSRLSHQFPNPSFPLSAIYHLSGLQAHTVNTRAIHSRTCRVYVPYTLTSLSLPPIQTLSNPDPTPSSHQNPKPAASHILQHKYRLPTTSSWPRSRAPSSRARPAAPWHAPRPNVPLTARTDRCAPRDTPANSLSLSHSAHSTFKCCSRCPWF